MILDHAHPKVMQAIKRQAEEGWHFGLVHELEVGLSESIIRNVPSAQLVRFASSGSEAAKGYVGVKPDVTVLRQCSLGSLCQC